MSDLFSPSTPEVDAAVARIVQRDGPVTEAEVDEFVRLKIANFDQLPKSRQSSRKAAAGTWLEACRSKWRHNGEAQALQRDAQRYRWLRSRDLSTIERGGVFAGMTPANVVLAEEDLDRAVDEAMGRQPEGSA